MRKHKFILITLLAACILGLGLFAIALAQETETIDTMPEEEMDFPMTYEMGPPPEEVIQDMEITAGDLGASQATILPDSIFHPFKRFGRNFMEVITFDPVKDAELKLRHANQELSEIKQLIDEDGIENIDSEDLIDSVEWFEGKMEKIKDAAENLKEEKNDNIAGVEALLNDLTDKQFKEHKVFENFYEEVSEHKDIMPNAEDIFVTLKDKQSDTLKRFGETLTIIDDAEKIPERLSSIANNQKGSEFKLIKASEILEKLEEQVPIQAKEAIERAQEKTFEKLQEDIAELPPIVRAEKFEKYTNSMPGDETVYLGIFEKMKQLPDIPQDILEKIEEVKEFAVKRFEDKIEKFDTPEVKDQFFENLDGDDLDDIMALEELKAKITAKQEAIKNRVDEEHAKGISAFKKQFTDVQSQTQADRFERLIKEMTSNPNPKIMRLINELEKEVSQDAEKKAFIEDIKTKTKAEFENKFRQEGDRFFDRIATYNPEDMMVFREFEQEQFFDPRMMEQFYDHQTNIFKEHIQGIENPEMFNRFDERMRFAPPEVINIIQTRDSEFGEMLQFKARKMMEMELELKEREMQMAMERSWRENEDDFQIQLRQVQNDDAKAQLYEQRREQDFALMDREFEERKMIMEARFSNDPFCDAMCQEFQKMHMEQDMINRQWHLQEDARMREFELEMQMKDQMQHDPFAGKCYDPRSCMEHCMQNPGAQGCGGMGQMPIDPYMMPGSDIMYGMMPGMPMGPPPCPMGEISMPTGPGQWVCKQDPYYRPPEFFKQCPPGNHWNEQRGFCEFDESFFQPMPPMPGDPYMPGMPGEPYPGPYPPTPPAAFCGPGEYWDNMRGCVREDFKQCGPGEYWDFYEQNCRMDKWQSCPPGEYWDPGRNNCMRDVFEQPTQCPPGEFYDFFKRQCIAEHFPVQCGPNEYWDPGVQECRPSSSPTSCPAGQYWNPVEYRCIGNVIDPSVCTTEWDPVCGADNITYSNECHAKQNGMSWQYRGECAGIDQPPVSGYCGDGRCEGGEYCPQDCELHPTAGCNYIYSSNDCTSQGCVWCSDTNACYDPGYSCSYMSECNNNNYCDYNENMTSCPSDCVQPECLTCDCGDNICNDWESAETCPNDCGTTTACPSSMYNDYTTSYYCSTTNCPNGCNFDYNGCPTGCMTDGSTCPTNSYTTSAGACDYTMCPNGCNFTNGCPSSCMAADSAGCGAYIDSMNCANQGCTWCSDINSCYYSGYVCGDTVTCPTNSYTTSAGACDYTMCPNGCNFNYDGCPDSCMTSGMGCESYTDSASCYADSNCGVWCDSEYTTSMPNVCYIPGHVCGSGGTTTECPSTMYNDYTTSYTCSYTYCPNGCNFNNAGCPDSCMDSGGNIGCGSYTDSASCNADSACGVWCEGESTPYSCFSPGHTCGGTMGCYTFYDNSSCASAGCTWCDSNNMCEVAGFTCGSAIICGDGICEGAEDSWSCETDCGAVISCGDGYCDPSEDSWSCPSDCGPAIVCGDGACDSGEDEYSCPSDCGSSMGCNYDNVCDYDETMESCPSDCSGGCVEPDCTPPPASIFDGIKIFFQRLFGF